MRRAELYGMEISAEVSDLLPRQNNFVPKRTSFDLVWTEALRQDRARLDISAENSAVGPSSTESYMRWNEWTRRVITVPIFLWQFTITSAAIFSQSIQVAKIICRDIISLPR